VLQTMQNWWLQGVALAKEYRKQGVAEIPTEDWFKARFNDPEVYDDWANRVIKPIEVSDTFYDALRPEQQEQFRRQQFIRFQYGLWVDIPQVKRMSDKEVKQARELNPYAYKYQLLSGSHYFIMNYLMVNHVKYDVGYGPPDYFRRDALLLDMIDCCMYYPLAPYEHRLGMMVFKPRGTHFTTNANGVVIKNMLLPRQFNGIGSIDVDIKVPTSGDVYRMYYERLPSWIKERCKKTKATNSGGQFVFALDKDLGDGQKTSATYNIQNSVPKGFEMKRSNFLFSDEINLITYDISVFLEKARGVLLDGNRVQSGFFIGGGVSDNQNVNIEKFKSLTKHPESYNLCVLFNGLHHYGEPDEKGWTNEKAILESDWSIREAKRQMGVETGDMSAYITHISQNPRGLNDCFYSVTADLLDSERINRHIDDVNSRMVTLDPDKRIKIDRGWLKIDKVIRGEYIVPAFHPDTDNGGGWYIFEHPPIEVYGPHLKSTYIAGSDNVDMYINADEAKRLNTFGKTRGLSKQSMVVINALTNKVAALYLYRHQDPREDYLQKLLGCMYYNCQVFSERNKPGEINYFLNESEYIHLGFRRGYFKRYQMKCPRQFVGVKRHGDEYGLDTQSNKSKFYMDYYVPYVKDNIENIMILPLLNDIAKWDIVNDKNSPDSCMALLICTIALSHQKAIIDIMSTSSSYDMARIYETARYSGKRGPRKQYGY
jgi:hypothetical protein